MAIGAPKRIDRSYIAPQLSAREKMVAGLFTMLDAGFLLLAIGTSILVCNMFSRSYPRRAKAINALVLLGGLALLAGLVALAAWAR
jgi:hypothetical protein